MITNTLKDRLISWWTFDETSGTAYDSLGRNHLAETSGTIDSTAGKQGTSRHIIAADTEYFLASEHNSFSFTGKESMTIGGWYRPSTGSLTVAHMLAQRATSIRFRINATTYVPSFAIYNGSYTAAAWGTGVSEATWYFIIGWYDAQQDVVAIQVNDGTPVTASQTTGFDTSGTGGLYVGSASDQSTLSWGRYDEWFMAHGVLTPDERTWLYNSASGRSYASVAQLSVDSGGFISDYGMI